MSVPILRTIACIMIVLFGANTVFAPVSFAQVPFLPAAGTMVTMTGKFNPVVIKGMKLYPDNPFKFDFIVDTGDTTLSQDELKEEGQKLIGYFLASLTTPEKDMWVNLSPYEKDRIIPTAFGDTEMGKELLAQDYLLKQIMATALYPQRELGRQFWQKVYSEAQLRFGTTNVPVNTFNKVWILPDKALVYENSRMNSVFVVESSLKVMLEEDYLALGKNQRQPGDMFSTEQQKNVSPSRLPSEIGLNTKAPQGNNSNALPAISAIGSQIIREIVIPALQKEVNEGKNFAPLRQVYQSLILAAWYKKNLKDNVIAKAYVDRNKTKGVDVSDKNIAQKIYKQYLQAYRKGVYNFIKEDKRPNSFDSTPGDQPIVRKYFSGGVIFWGVNPAVTTDRAMVFSFLKKTIGHLLRLSMVANPANEEEDYYQGRLGWYRTDLQRRTIHVDIEMMAQRLADIDRIVFVIKNNRQVGLTPFDKKRLRDLSEQEDISKGYTLENEYREDYTLQMMVALLQKLNEPPEDRVGVMVYLGAYYYPKIEQLIEIKGRVVPTNHLARWLIAISKEDFSNPESVAKVLEQAKMEVRLSRARSLKNEKGGIWMGKYEALLAESNKADGDESNGFLISASSQIMVVDGLIKQVRADPDLFKKNGENIKYLSSELEGVKAPIVRITGYIIAIEKKIEEGKTHDDELERLYSKLKKLYQMASDVQKNWIRGGVQNRLKQNEDFLNNLLAQGQPASNQPLPGLNGATGAYSMSQFEKNGKYVLKVLEQIVAVKTFIEQIRSYPGLYRDVFEANAKEYHVLVGLDQYIANVINWLPGIETNASRISHELNKYGHQLTEVAKNEGERQIIYRMAAQEFDGFLVWFKSNKLPISPLSPQVFLQENRDFLEILAGRNFRRNIQELRSYLESPPLTLTQPARVSEWDGGPRVFRKIEVDLIRKLNGQGPPRTSNAAMIASKPGHADHAMSTGDKIKWVAGILAGMAVGAGGYLAYDAAPQAPMTRLERMKLDWEKWDEVRMQMLDPRILDLINANHVPEVPKARPGGDHAMNGGIDLEKVDVNAIGGGVKTAFSDPEQLKMLLNADGLIPVIYKIQPMTVSMMNMLLGISSP